MQMMLDLSFDCQSMEYHFVGAAGSRSGMSRNRRNNGPDRAFAYSDGAEICTSWKEVETERDGDWCNQRGHRASLLAADRHKESHSPRVRQSSIVSTAPSYRCRQASPVKKQNRYDVNDSNTSITARFVETSISFFLRPHALLISTTIH